MSDVRVTLKSGEVLTMHVDDSLPLYWQFECHESAAADQAAARRALLTGEPMVGNGSVVVRTAKRIEWRDGHRRWFEYQEV